MDLLSIFLIGVALSMDAFAVSICKGLSMRTPSIKQMLIVGIWFGGFQGLMPVIGYYLGSYFYDFIANYAHWVAFILLLGIGLNMIREALSDEEEELDDSLGFKIMLLLAIATSIDALAIGISFAMEGTEIVLPALLIALTTMVLSMIAVKLGSVIGDKYNTKAEIAGGIILILIGFKILLENLGFL